MKNIQNFQKETSNRLFTFPWNFLATKFKKDAYITFIIFGATLSPEKQMININR